jgi:hypothetical protein
MHTPLDNMDGLQLVQQSLPVVRNGALGSGCRLS